MTHPERVHSRAQLLDRVWGDHVFIEERTVDVHVKRLREALSGVNCPHMIETVRGAGYRLTQRRPRRPEALARRRRRWPGCCPASSPARWRSASVGWSACCRPERGAVVGALFGGLLGFLGVVLVRRDARLAADALAAPGRARDDRAARRRLLGRDRLSHRAACATLEREAEHERTHLDPVPLGDRGFTQRRAAARRRTTRSSGATRAPPTISASIRSATGASASPTWSARRPSSPTCRPATSTSRSRCAIRAPAGSLSVRSAATATATSWCCRRT